MKTYYNETKEQIDKKLVEDLVAEIRTVLIDNDSCTLAIAGGRSIATVLDTLVLQDLPWEKLKVFAVDDRCLPIDDEESNSYLIAKHLGDKVPVEFYPFTFEPDLDDKGASKYTEVLNQHGGKFDLLILSAGEDGHTAGLFPGNQGYLSEAEGYVFMNDSPKPPAERVSATRGTLLKSKAAFVMFIGEAKREAHTRFGDGTVQEVDCPVKITRRLPETYVYTDLS